MKSDASMLSPPLTSAEIIVLRQQMAQRFVAAVDDYFREIEKNALNALAWCAEQEQKGE